MRAPSPPPQPRWQHSYALCYNPKAIATQNREEYPVLQIQTEILEDHQAKLTVTVEPERLQQEMQAAARRIAREVNIPGFRRGKAPYHIIRQYFGEESILEEALDSLGQAVYKEALQESQIKPYGPGVMTDFSRDSLTMTFLVPLMPEVDLGNYREVRVPFESPTVTDEDVEEILSNLREQSAELNPVDRPIEMGTVALLDIVGTLVRPTEAAEGEEKPAVWLSRKGVRVKIAEDASYPVPGFPAHVVGMAAGDTRAFEISFVADDEEVSETLRGKTLHFEVRCEQVYEHNLPELNDEFAQSVGEFEGLEDLRKAIRTQLEEEAKHKARDLYLEKALEALRSVATLRYPSLMVEEWVDNNLEELTSTLRNEGLSLEEYLRLNNLTLEQLRDRMRLQARQQIEHALLLEELADAEQISVSDEEVQDEIRTMALGFGARAPMAIREFSQPPIQSRIGNRLRREKVIERLIQIARGEAPEISAEPPQDTLPAEDMPQTEESSEIAAESDKTE